MEAGKDCVLTINGGSSSIKFALYETGVQLNVKLYGEIENIGVNNARLSFTKNISHENNNINAEAPDANAAADFLINWLEKQEDLTSLKAIGHRIVHGMKHTHPECITPELIEELKVISGYDPEHLPGEIRLIEVFQKRFPALVQVACFDTSFHTTMPMVAKLLAIPRRYASIGLQRYGFHGLSYAYLMEELARTAGNKTAKGRVILAHLGSGASLAAVKEGKSIDTSMGFTPTSGLPMGTRTGDLDPGVAWYLMQAEKINAGSFNHLINHDSGMLGISETSADMRELLKIRDADSRAADAVELFCYQTKKWIGAYAAVLGGIDTVIFAGGIGEHAPEIRSAICAGLQFLGIEIDESKNVNNETIISVELSKVCVRVIKTNEQLMIAKLVCETLSIS